MTAGWVNFAQVKATVCLRRVLEDYGILEQLRRSGQDHYRGPCPIHQGEGRDAFHGDLGKNVFFMKDTRSLSQSDFLKI